MTSSFLHLSIALASRCTAGLWQGAALALLASALLRLVPKASAAFRHSMLVAIFFIAALLPWTPSVAQAASTQKTATPLHAATWIAAAITIAWISAAAVRATHLAGAWLHLRRVRRNAVPVAIAGHDSFEAGGRRAILCVSDEVDSPAILGFTRPVLVLPKWLLPKLTESTLRQIALHECEHLTRRDDWMNLLLQVGLVLMPLNPALHWLNRNIGIERELACDAKVVSSTAEPLAYAAALTQFAEQRMQHKGLRLALAAWGRKSELTRRIFALLGQRPAWSNRQSSIACAVTATLLLTVSAGLAHAPRLVQFADTPRVLASASVPTITKVPSTFAADLVRAGMRSDAPAARVVPAAFTIKPEAKMHRATAKDKAAPQPRSAQRAIQVLPRHQAAAPFLRTAAQEYGVADRDEQNDASVHFVTADFITPYVAVPVRNGWILIEL